MSSWKSAVSHTLWCVALLFRHRLLTILQLYEAGCFYSVVWIQGDAGIVREATDWFTLIRLARFPRENMGPVDLCKFGCDNFTIHFVELVLFGACGIGSNFIVAAEAAGLSCLFGIANASVVIIVAQEKCSVYLKRFFLSCSFNRSWRWCFLFSQLIRRFFL